MFQDKADQIWNERGLEGSSRSSTSKMERQHSLFMDDGLFVGMEGNGLFDQQELEEQVAEDGLLFFEGEDVVAVADGVRAMEEAIHVEVGNMGIGGDDGFYLGQPYMDIYPMYEQQPQEQMPLQPQNLPPPLLPTAVPAVVVEPKKKLTTKKRSLETDDGAESESGTNKKAVDVQSYMLFLLIASEHMKANRTGKRDFKGFGDIAKALHPEELKELIKFPRQELKNLIGERRKRSCLDGWKLLEEACGVLQRNAKGGLIKVPGLDNDKIHRKKVVYSNGQKLQALLNRWFSDPIFHDGSFIPVIQNMLLDKIAEKQNSPGTILELPEMRRKVIIDKLVELHQKKYGNKFHLLYEKHFSKLFSVSDIEMAILSSCDCEDCARDWELSQIDRTNVKALQLHYTKQKAAQGVNLLSLHVACGSELYDHMATRPQPKMQGWNDKDIDTLLKSFHTCKHCYVCQNKRRARIGSRSSAEEDSCCGVDDQDLLDDEGKPLCFQTYDLEDNFGEYCSDSEDDEEPEGEEEADKENKQL